MDYNYIPPELKDQLTQEQIEQMIEQYKEEMERKSI